ncbi:MAG: response regulator transcription factor [Ilumatobacter sp.]|uniref:response regulator transcription factor n=1 Tax=Ilumatobacter sp. TaxID=1967498 RepID=UPI00391B154C
MTEPATDTSASAASGAVLVVEDDADVRSAIATGLEVNGFSVVALDSAEAALAEITGRLPDLIVLDVGLAGMSGIDLCAALRSRQIDVPILVLSARDEVGDRVAGLQAGADDYLVKPFDLTELVARLQALLRRAGTAAASGPSSSSTSTSSSSESRSASSSSRSASSSSRLVFGSLSIDLDRRIAETPDTRLELTRREFDLLAVLAQHRGIVLSRIQLLELVWGYDFEADTNVVDVFVGYLRKKMSSAGLPKLISTVRGVGFVMERS